MSLNAPLITPYVGKKAPALGPCAIIASTLPDLQMLRGLLGLPKDKYRQLNMSRLFRGQKESAPCLVGPVTGAPYAVIILETLIAWGVQQVVFVGWCGSIALNVKTGDMILPDAAFIDEGTSSHYQASQTAFVKPSNKFLLKLEEQLTGNGLDYHKGSVWTTDAVFQETPRQVKYYQNKGAIGVEMEISALFTVAAFHKIDLAAILTVSDELGDYNWRPGFKDAVFKQRCNSVCRAACDFFGR